jgi:glycosyltransferase involved in cell wall biosynthesis
VRAVPLAFYAPMKSPSHPSPSGDRTMARLLFKALAQAGFKPEVASELRTWDRAGDAAFQAEARQASHEEADRLVARWSGGGGPRLWFTYHIYYKAPDWIGPRVADTLGIPYVVAEGSRAGKRAAGPWALGHAGAEAALDRADAVFVMTEVDREGLERHRPERQRLLDLPPFLDLGEWNSSQAPAQTRREDRSSVRLLTVAMMRRGDKLESYGILAKALAQAADEAWTLDVAGDGEAQDEVRKLFADFGPRVTFRGRLDGAALAHLYAAADLLVWPAVNEAYGMVLLEAQAFGCPVLACRYGGVASVVREAETGVLTPPGDDAAFADALSRLLRDGPYRRALGEGAYAFVTQERGLDQAAVRMRDGLMPLLPER